MKLTFTENAMQRLGKLGMAEEISLYMSTIYGCGGPDSSMFTIRAYDTENPYYDTVLDTNFGTVRVTRDSLQQLDEDNIIDFNDSSFSFVLKSNRGLLNPNMNYENMKLKD
ncbi:uncharacterized protein YqkB [Trichococcus patagoniensis]|uniref:Uncharacterized protein YqkB n=1 Tax=Trichococcus patagoniensis TaxID=382641 RepID=A0A2T5IPM4_9LACT|nr:iron-sulfur cluster biosynthesis family protein [Trichococcus patagoniensis]PTQ85781.1 uncharacterized protein YqkB [Trichococcus patagoniensis]